MHTPHGVAGPRPGHHRRIAGAAAIAAATVAAGIGFLVSALPAASATSTASISPFAVPSGVGASVPFTEYEAESAATTGSVAAADYTQGTVASEASGRRYVSLGQGQYVEFTLTAAANAVDVAYNLARGASGSLSIYVNGTKITPKLALNAKYSYLDTGNIGGSKTHHLFDDARVMLGTAVGVGGKVRLQVDPGDGATNVDVADFENVAAALTAPSNSISVTSAPYNADPTGAGDSTSAFNQAIAAARGQGRSVWIPSGTFTISSPLQIDSVTLQGAGPWYSVLHGTHLIDNGSSTGPIKLSDFAAIGEVTTRNDGSPDNFINGSLGTGSVVSDIWIQHQKVGLWLVGANNTNLTIQNNRILDTTADGINFNGTVTNSTVRNNFIRNTGDDGIALWSLYAADANNTIANNTLVQPNLANGIALYGGTSNTLSNNVVADTNALGSGIAISNQQFIANGTFSPLAGTITISGNYLIRAGALNPNWGHPMSAIRFDAYDFAFSGVTVNLTGGQIVDSPYSAVEIVGGDGTGRAVNGLSISNLTVSTVGTVVMQAETQGTGAFSGIVASGVGVAGVYNCSYPAGTPNYTFNLGTGNSGWSSTWPGCTFPSPGATATGTPTGGPPTSAPPTTAPPTSAPPTSATPTAAPTTGGPCAVGSGNLALHKTATAASSTQTYVAGDAVDGDANTYWESANDAFPQTLTVDLCAPATVNQVVLRLPPATAWATRTQTLTVQGSTDGSSFSPLVGSAGYTFDPATGNAVTIAVPGATVRYVRLTFTANTGWPAGQVSEFEVYGSGGGGTTAPPGNTNLAAGRSTSASSTTQTYGSANAVDGDANTYWESANSAFPQWLQVDLGAATSVSRVVLKLPPATAWATRTQTLTVQGSTDGSSFSPLVGSAGYTFDPATGNTVTITFPASQLRYLRLTFTANTGWPAGQLSEFEVYPS